MEPLTLRIAGPPQPCAGGGVQFTLRGSRGPEELGLFAACIPNADLMAWDPAGLTEAQRHRAVAETLAAQIRSDDARDPFSEYQSEVRIIPLSMAQVRGAVANRPGPFGDYVDGVEV